VKHSIFWWLVRFVSFFVFVFSATLLYQYWELTQKKQIMATPTVVLSPVGKSSVQTSDGVRVLTGYIVPTVFMKGSLVNYQFQQNSKTNETELYATLSTKEGLLPARIDNITISGRKPVYLFVKDLNEETKKQITEILNDGRVGSPLVNNTYIILSSINSQDQVKTCRDNNPEASNDWCPFDSAKKSYSTDDLSAQIKKYLNTNSEYLYLSGNVLLTLQVNYHYEPK